MSEKAVKKLNEIKSQWSYFKSKRKRNTDEFSQKDEGFLTMIERENMIDRLLEIIYK